jgi:conjugative relaxase-like TrwC/TraI family protein
LGRRLWNVVAQPIDLSKTNQAHTDALGECVARADRAAAWEPMVSIGKPGRGQERYYVDQAIGRVSAAAAVASGVEDYYVRGGEPAGRWIGGGARRLGLDGLVRPEDLERVLTGQHPRDGSLLRLRGSVPGFDVTFSAPKSVSLLFAVGQGRVSDAVLAAHEKAVAEAFGYLERSAAVGRRGAGGVERVLGDGLVGASFLHRTSRAGDPQLHTHVLAANLVRDSAGRWTALDARALYAEGRTAGYLYQAVLRDELTRSLGVEWKPLRKGGAEIDGVPERVLRAFSRRRADIEASMAAVGGVGPNAARVAAFATRRAKDYRVRPEALVDEWRLRAAKLGLAGSQIERLLDRSEPVRLGVDDWVRIFGDLSGPDGLTAKRSTFTRADVIRGICERLPCGAPASVVERATDAFLGSTHAVRLLVPREAAERPVAIRRQDGRQVILPHEPVYSTPELLRVERQILDRAAASVGAGAAVVREADVERAIFARPWLAREQVDMVRRLTRDGDAIAVVVGKAGTGKTSALAAANEAWTESGIPVVGVAVARRAAHELEHSAGIPSTSVAAVLRRPEAIPSRGVVVLDEAGMVGTRPLAELVARAEAARAKLVLVGDHRQLPALEAGGALRTLAARLDPIVLRENRRQREAWERDAVELLRDGSVDEALEVYATSGRLFVGERGDDVMRKLVSDWHAAGDPAESVMIAHRRRDVAELNGRARAALREAGRLGPVELQLPGGAFAAGDQVVLKLNDRRLGVRNNERGVVVGVDRSRHALDVHLGDRTVRLPRAFLQRRTARGDPTLQHGYAITAYVAQGLTCEKAFVLARDDAYREWAYTTMSRARNGSRLYVVAERMKMRDEFAPAEPQRDQRAALAAALSRSQHRGMAHDMLEQSRGLERD